MWIVVDWYHTIFYGPFNSALEARLWARRMLGEEDIEDYEYTVSHLTDIKAVKQLSKHEPEVEHG
jgi:hypothetical protein